MEYEEFLRKKQIKEVKAGFPILWSPTFLFGFQLHLVTWALQLGRAAIWAECGLGKSIMSLVWSENIIRKFPGSRVLILTPLAVTQQFKQEAAKFGMSANVTREGELYDGINITNYERLHYYKAEDFKAVVVDEASCIKGHERQRRKEINTFLNKLQYRLLCTATPSPNDFMELGTASEALGNMSRNQMLGMFFTNSGETTQQWELKGHAKRRFWQWISTWARAVRKPSDLGFSDEGFVLPELRMHRHILSSGKDRMEGFFVKEARTLEDQRAERRRTLKQRCQKIADLIPKDEPVLIWVQLNDEGEYLEKIIPNSINVSGKNSDNEKEAAIEWFKGNCICGLKKKKKSTTENGTKKTRNTLKNTDKKQKTEEMLEEENFMLPIKNTKRMQKEKLKNGKKTTQSKDLLKECDIMELPQNNFGICSKNKAAVVQSAELKLTQILQEKQVMEDCTLTTTTKRGKFEDYYVPTATMELENSKTIQGSSKEECCTCKANNSSRIVISKSRIFGFGLNLQHCHTVVYMPDHSSESFYQAIRRTWRFGQKFPVDCHIVTTEAEKPVLDNMLLKEKKAVELYDSVVHFMNDAIKIVDEKAGSKKIEIPSWIRSTKK